MTRDDFTYALDALDCTTGYVAEMDSATAIVVRVNGEDYPVSSLTVGRDSHGELAVIVTAGR